MAAESSDSSRTTISAAAVARASAKAEGQAACEAIEPTSTSTRSPGVEAIPRRPGQQGLYEQLAADYLQRRDPMLSALEQIGFRSIRPTGGAVPQRHRLVGERNA